MVAVVKSSVRAYLGGFVLWWAFVHLPCMILYVGAWVFHERNVVVGWEDFCGFAGRFWGLFIFSPHVVS